MKIRLDFGKTGLDLDLPKNVNPTVVEPRHLPGLSDPAGAVRAALCQPIGLAPLRQVAQSSDRIGIVFSDITRPTPNRLLLATLLGELSQIPDEHITLFNSTGTHRPNTRAELVEMLGAEIVGRFCIVQNEATDSDAFVCVGVTSTGNAVWIHRGLVECDLRILTGFIEPHLFAGFSGGGKALLPGMARLDSILRNHSARHLDSPQARWGIREGNPVWEEIRQAAAMLSPNFLLNVTLNRDKQITRVFAGDLEQAHAQGCAFVRETAMAPVSRPFDIVIGSNSGYPLDLNVYQAVKGMSAAAQLVRAGGSIIIAADCWDGLPDQSEYAELLHRAPNLESLLETIRTPGFEKQDMWEAQIQALISLKADVYLYSRNLSEDQIRSAHLKPCHDLKSTVDALLAKYGPEATVCVLPQGPQVIPYIDPHAGG